MNSLLALPIALAVLFAPITALVLAAARNGCRR